MGDYRTMNRLAITFGMVVIPVGMVKATDDGESVAFCQLCPDHPDSGVKYRKFCAIHEHQIEGKPLRGYTVVKPSAKSAGQYVVIDDELLEELPLPTAHVIKIEEFVEAKSIGPLYPEGAYFLVPEDVGAPAYNILRAALAKSKKVGIGKYALRGAEHFCRVEEYEGVILLTPMHYPSEVREVGRLGVPVMDLKPAEVAMGVKLIEAQTAAWQPEKYRNEAAAALKEVVAAKLAGEEAPHAAPAPKPAAADLMAVLAASVQAAQATAKPAAKKPAARSSRGRAA